MSNTPSFRIDLTDVHSSGVYLVGHEDIDTLDAGANRDGFNVHQVDLAGCTSQADLTRCLAEGFALPARFGEDWPGVVAYLQRMDAIPSRGHVVLLRHADQVQPQAVLDPVLDMLEDTAAIWSGEGVSFFVFSESPVTRAPPEATE